MLFFSGGFVDFKLMPRPAGCYDFYRKSREVGVRPGGFLLFWGVQFI